MAHSVTGGQLTGCQLTPPDSALLRWVVAVAAAGGEVDEVRGLRDGGSPWLVRLSRGRHRRSVVLRVGEARDRSPLRTEVAALQLAAGHDVPAPRLIAAELDADPPVVLAELLAGESAIPPDCPPARLQALGAAAATLHAIALDPSPLLPSRQRPIASEDFAALRSQQPVPAAEPGRGAGEGLAGAGRRRPVHGDLWQGNALWTGEALVGLVDWDCAGAGPAGVDIGSLRCDAALCFGPGAVDHVRRGWEEAAGRPAEDVAYWDIVAALSTPPDMGWFTQAIAGQGRPDLTRRILLQRRDAFLRAALDRLGREG